MCAAAYVAYPILERWNCSHWILDSQSPQEPTAKNDFQQPGGGYVGYTTAASAKNMIFLPVRQISCTVESLDNILRWAKLAGPINADFSWKHIHWPNSFSRSIKTLVSTVLNKARRAALVQRPYR